METNAFPLGNNYMKAFSPAINVNRIALFTDASINTRFKIGFGAYLVLPEPYLEKTPYDLIKEVKLQKFKSTSSTKIEIETLLWALEELEKSRNRIDLYCNLIIYTDSQCVAGLLCRRAKLENSGFKSSRTNKQLNNALLYCKFYSFSDRLKFEIIKLKGHSRSITKDIIHKIFSNVDIGSRKALRDYLDLNKDKLYERIIFRRSKLNYKFFLCFLSKIWYNFILK